MYNDLYSIHTYKLRGTGESQKYAVKSTLCIKKQYTPRVFVILYLIINIIVIIDVNVYSMLTEVYCYLRSVFSG